MLDELLNGQRTHKTDIIRFYIEQIKRYKKIGVGNKSEFNTLITERIIDNTRKRLEELQKK